MVVDRDSTTYYWSPSGDDVDCLIIISTVAFRDWCVLVCKTPEDFIKLEQVVKVAINL